ncbi:LysM peptidoglycan-binding domain-containing protein [Anaerohalosphaera lusitana]|uniref:LysM peptidoglycan-binding domain-containing protein n=1 Tax=Anaerohalosphaera lusitana TaxID=1936003 RepID=UPI00197CA8AB
MIIMPRDLKIGILIGFLFATAATVTVSMWPTEDLASRQKRAFEKNQSNNEITIDHSTYEMPADVDDKESQENSLKWGLSEDHPAVAEDDLFDSLDTTKRNSESANPKNEKVHVVTKGETLSSIARDYYGNQSKWKLIQESNDIDDPKAVRPGMELVIPQ